MYKISAVMDNYTSHTDCKAEHGLSYFIETQKANILFDTGQTESFIQNAEKLNIPIENTDYLLLSHGHYDHTGGIKALLNKTNNLKIVAHPEVFSERYHVKDGKKRNISFPFTKDELESMGADFHLTDEPYFFDQNLYTTGEVVDKFDNKAIKHFYKKHKNTAIPDVVEDDLSLLLIFDHELNIITGCSHAGILNIVDHAIKLSGINKINMIIGGLHFDKMDENYVKDTLYELNQYDISHIAISHCTGINSMEIMKENLASEISYFGIGMTISIQ